MPNGVDPFGLIEGLFVPRPPRLDELGQEGMALPSNVIFHAEGLGMGPYKDSSHSIFNRPREVIVGFVESDGSLRFEGPPAMTDGRGNFITRPSPVELAPINHGITGNANHLLGAGEAAGPFGRQVLSNLWQPSGNGNIFEDIAADSADGGCLPAMVPPVWRLNPVTERPRVGSAIDPPITRGGIRDPHHAFPDVVDNFAGDAIRFEIPTLGPGGRVVGQAELFQVEGSLNGTSGVFEWIVDSGNVTHRRFIPGGSVTGMPNQVPR